MSYNTVTLKAAILILRMHRALAKTMQSTYEEAAEVSHICF